MSDAVSLTMGNSGFVLREGLAADVQLLGQLLLRETVQLAQRDKVVTKHGFSPFGCRTHSTVRPGCGAAPRTAPARRRTLPPPTADTPQRRASAGSTRGRRRQPTALNNGRCTARSCAAS